MNWMRRTNRPLLKFGPKSGGWTKPPPSGFRPPAPESLLEFNEIGMII